MDWSQALSERFIATPAIRWLNERRLNLYVDNQKIQYSIPQIWLISLIGRAIKRGTDLSVFFPCIGDADLALIITYMYALHADVRHNLSVPGKWMNRRVVEFNKDVIIIGNGPALRKLLVNRCQLGSQPIHDYMGVHWLARNKNISKDSLFANLGKDLAMDIYIIPKSKVSEHNFDQYQQICHPFVILYDLTTSASADKNLIYQYHIFKDAFPSVPVIFLCSCGDMAAMKMLRDEKGISLWVTRANDILSLEKQPNVTQIKNETQLTQHSLLLANGISITVQIIHDIYFNDALGEMLVLLRRIFEETKKTTAMNDNIVNREARTILRELGSLSVPLSTQEELHRLERRSSMYVTRMLRNRIVDLGDWTGSVGLTNELVSSLVVKLTVLTDILAKTQARTGKTQAVLEWVQAEITKSKKIIIACPNESIRVAMIGYLSKQNIDTIGESVRVHTHSSLWRQAKDTSLMSCKVLWIGMPDFYSGAYFGGILPDITIMIYPIEREGLEKQLGYINQNTQKLSRPAGDKLTFLRNLGQIVEDREVVAENEAPWLLSWIELDLVGTYPGDPPKFDAFTLPEVDWMTDWISEPVSSTQHHISNILKPSMTITLSDGEADIVLPLNASVVVLDQISNSSEGLVPVWQLHTGQTILVSRDDPRRSLINQLIEYLRYDPEYDLNEQLAERWYFAVEVIAAHTGSDAEKALNLLKEYNVDVETPQAVSSWFNHLVIGPRSFLSLKAVANASGLEDIIKNINPIWNAIKYVRVVHVKLGRQIAAYVKAGMGIRHNDLISKELNLYGSDLEELTRIGEILHISRQ